MHSDPLVPVTSRFPLTSNRGRVLPSSETPTGPDTRPFGMRFAVVPQMSGNGHSKRPTQKSRSKQTAITDDGQVTGYQTDVEYYTEMDEE